MTISLKADASGTFGTLQVGGVDKVTVGANGIAAGSYAPNSITATELAAGALIETSPTSLIGYGVGAGGTVAQATSKSTAVTLNKPCGQITMHNASLAANSEVTFTLNNTLIAPADIITVSIAEYGGAVTNYHINTMAKSAGGGTFIGVRNVTGAPLVDALPINFTVIKGATS